MGDGGEFFLTGIGALPAGGALVTTGALDEVNLDGGLSVLLTFQMGQTLLGGAGADGVAVSPTGMIFTTGQAQVFRVIGSNATLFAGNGIPGNCDDSGGDAGPGFITPWYLAADSVGDVFVTDNDSTQQSGSRGCTRIRKITPDGTATTLAGTGWPGNTDGPGPTASFNFPAGLAVDSAGNVYVADVDNRRIRKIDPHGTVSTLAGSGIGFDDGTGGANGTATFNSPTSVAVDASGNVYVADSANSAIRKIFPDGTTVTLAGNGSPGYFDGTLGRNGTTQFNDPEGVAVDNLGNVYVADTGNCAVRVIHQN